MEQAAIVTSWVGDGTDGNPWTPVVPPMPQGAKWEDISTVSGTGVPGGSATYTIRVTAPEAFIDQLETEPGLVVGWREKTGAGREVGAQVGNVPYTDFANKLVAEGLYADLAEVVAVFGLDTNQTWGEIAVKGIINQVAIGNGGAQLQGLTPIPDTAALLALLP